MLAVSLQKISDRVRQILGLRAFPAEGALKVQPSDVARQLYRDIVAQAREPVFYGTYKVPDTPDGRFDMIALHAALVMRRLRAEAALSPDIAQALFDQMFAEFDESLREMGVGDLKVGRVVKGMAKGFYGRLASYGSCLDANDRTGLEDALRRNVYRHAAADTATVAALADYVIGEAARLAVADPARLVTDGLKFRAPAPR